MLFANLIKGHVMFSKVTVSLVADGIEIDLIVWCKLTYIKYLMFAESS